MSKAKISALIALLVVGLAISALPMSSVSAQRKEEFMVGAAKAIITPTVNEADPYADPVWMGGWDIRVALGIHDELYARSVVVCSKGTTVALVAVDLVGWIKI